MRAQSASATADSIQVPLRPIIISSDRPLAQEISFFESNKDRLLKDHEGKYVLIKGSEIVGFFRSSTLALKEAYKQFGDTHFLVKEISDQDHSVNVGTLFLSKR